MLETKFFKIVLTRECEDINKESALEKFEYELKNGLYDLEAITIKQVKSID